MGHICGICWMQCYDLDRICAVLTVKKKKGLDNFPVEQGTWKVNIHPSSQTFPVLMVNEHMNWKLPSTEGNWDTVLLF